MHKRFNSPDSLRNVRSAHCIASDHDLIDAALKVGIFVLQLADLTHAAQILGDQFNVCRLQGLYLLFVCGVFG